ncbi:MAG: four helix bundle protein [Chitinophagaceae bacterium]
MATYTSFTELPIWIDAVDFAAEIYRFCDQGRLKSDYRMKDQLRAAASSIANNIAEGFEYRNRKTLIHFLKYSKGSAGEVFTQLTILFKATMITEEEYHYYSNKATELGNKINGFMKYLQSQQL